SHAKVERPVRITATDLAIQRRRVVGRSRKRTLPDSEIDIGGTLVDRVPRPPADALGSLRDLSSSRSSAYRSSVTRIWSSSSEYVRAAAAAQARSSGIERIPALLAR